MNRLQGNKRSARARSPSNGSNPVLPRLRRQLLARSLVAALASYVFLSCVTESNYRVLTLFFDGVPDPNQIEEPVVVPEPIDFTQLTSAERAEYLAQRIEAPTVYYHEPVQKRECESCHVAENRLSTQTGWMAGLPQLVVPIEELCGRCHEPPEARFVHGPVATGRCDICHAAHQSPFPHLLRFESVEGTCRSCHQGQTFVTDEAHAERGDQDCTECHDPHSASNRDLLLDPGAKDEPGSGG